MIGCGSMIDRADTGGEAVVSAADLIVVAAAAALFAWLGWHTCVTACRRSR
jgi:hypothetical protein